MGSPEVVVPFPARIVPLSEVRTTVLLSSQDALRKCGLYAAYLERIASHRRTLESMYAALWVPVDVAVAHYEACDRLALSHAQVVRLGRMVTTSTHNVFASTLLRVSRELGATPWAIYEQSDRFWTRAWNGSAVKIVRTAPKDAHISIAAMPLARIPYFRVAMIGFCEAVAELVASRAFARDEPAECTQTALGYRLAWA